MTTHRHDSAKAHETEKAHKPPLGSGKRFDALENKVSHEKGVHDPAALAASIGRNKYGKKHFAALGHHG